MADATPPLSVIDKARQAGFSEDEIQQWATSQTPAWKQAGFSDAEIHNFLGMPTTNTAMSVAKRVLDSTVDPGSQFNQFKADATPNAQDVIEGAAPGRQLFMRGLQEIGQGQSATGVGDAFWGMAGWVFGPIFNTVAAPITRVVTKATGNPDVGEKAGLLLGAGAPEGVAQQFAKDLAVSSALARGEKLVRPGAVADTEVGHLPTAQDHTDATKVITGGEVNPVVRQKLLTLSEDHGIHPAEVAADSGVHPEVKQAMLSPDPKELPTRYLASDNFTQQGDLFGGQPDQGSFRFMNDAEQTAPVQNAGEFRYGEPYTYNRLGEQQTVQSQPVRSKLFSDEEGPYSVATAQPETNVSPTGVFRGDQGQFQLSTGAMKQGELPLGTPEHQPSLNFDLFKAPEGGGTGGGGTGGGPGGGEPPVPKGFVRLYRGETDIPGERRPIPDWAAQNPDVQATLDATGRWFSDKREAADYYNQTFGDKSGRVSFVDVPAAEAEQYRVSNQPAVAKFAAEGRAAEEFFLPKEIAAERKALSPPSSRPMQSEGFVSPAEAEAIKADGGPVPAQKLDQTVQDIEGKGATEPAKPLFTYDDRNIFSKALSGAVDLWKKSFQPEFIRDALRADPRFAEYVGTRAAIRSRVVASVEKARQFFRSRSVEDNINYMVQMEDGKKFEGELGENAARQRDILDKADAIEKQFGSKADYFQNYFPHLFEKPLEAKAYLETRIGQMGPAWFQKQRAFQLIKDAQEHGLRLRSTNPEELVTQRLLDSADMSEKMRLLQDLEKQGFATPWKGANKDITLEGAQVITSPTGQQWAISKDVIPLWKNAVESKGLWANESPVGDVFRGWMAMKSVWVPIKLAASAFHFLHEVHIDFNNSFARAANELDNGNVLSALKAVGEGLGSAATLGMSHASKGSALRAAWLKPAAERTPEEAFSVSMMEKGGFVPQVPEELQIAGKQALEHAIDNNQHWATVPLAIRQAIKTAQAPLFEKYIPNLKAAAYDAEVSSFLRRHPEVMGNEEHLGAALRTIAKQVDNRYGEMTYGTVFWNRYAKDSAVGSFLSLGWNLGFAREFGGAFFDPVARVIQRGVEGPASEIQQIRRQAQNKLSFVMSYGATGMLMNGLMTYMFTGEMPTGMDYFLARIGGNNYDGTPRRVTNMTYLREIPAWLAHSQEHGGGLAGAIGGTREMLWNKMIFEPLAELANNRDYFGSQIWDETAPAYQQAWQATKGIFENQFNPIAVGGARQALSTGGTWSKDVPLSFLGFGPAPVYSARDATDNRIAYLYKTTAAPLTRSRDSGEEAKTRADLRQELADAQKSGNPAQKEAAAVKWFQAGGTRQGLANVWLGLGSTVGMFHALPEQYQHEVYDSASPEKQAQLEPYLKLNAARDVANLMMSAQMALQTGDTATAESKQQEIAKIMQQAVRTGHITNLNSFRNRLREELIARHFPDLGAIRALPKAMRPQYAPKVGLGGQPQTPQQ